MPSLPHRIADWVVDRRGVAIALVVILGLAAAALALRVESDFTPEELFTDNGDQRRQTEKFRTSFGNTDNVLVVLVEADDVLTPAPLAYLRDLTDYATARDYTGRVASVTRIPLARRTGPPRPLDAPLSLPALLADLARGHLEVGPIIGDGEVTAGQASALADALEETPLVWGQLVARDRTVGVVAIAIDPALDKVEQLDRVVTDIEGWLADHPPPDGARVHLGGLPYIRVDVVRKMSADQTVLFPAAFLVILLILLATFRWLPAVVFPMLAVALSAGVLMGLFGLTGEKLNIINSIVPILVIVIGISDSIHLVNRYGEELQAGGDRLEAARRATRTMLVAMLLTSFTTAVGFASLVVSQLPALGRFGVTAAIGVLVAYVITIAMVPGALSLVAAPRRAIADAEHGVIERLLGPLVDRVIRARVPILIGAAIIAAACAQAARSVPIDTAVHHQWKPGTSMYRTLQLLENRLDGLRPVEIGLFAEPGRFARPDAVQAVDRITRWAESRPGVLSAASHADLLHHAWFVATGDPAARTAPLDDPDRIATLTSLLEQEPDQLSRFLTGDRGAARISIRLADVGGKATIALVDDLRATLDRELPDDIEPVITGEGYVASAGLTTLTRDLLGSLLLAIAVIFGFLTLVLRSLRLGLISIPPNALPLVATIAYLWLRDIPLSPATVIIFSISIGLAVDGTIHMLARFREELACGRNRDDSIRAAARGTGKAVVVSYVSLIIGFVVFRLSEFVPVQQFGELISVTVIGCLISTLVVLPALLSVAGPRQNS